MEISITSFIEQYNSMFDRIEKANTVNDMRNLLSDIKNFYSMYIRLDSTSAEQIYNKYVNKLNDMIKENGIVYDRMSEKANSISRKEYDFSGEKDDTVVVNSMVCQLMAQLPKTQTIANSNKIKNIIEQTISSGVVGCKAILELMKYPVYLNMMTERQRQCAFDGSKTATQQAFESLKKKELKEVEKARADIYLQGFHLRTILKKIESYKKTSVWAN